MIVGSGLEDAALVVRAGFSGVLVGKEDLDAGEIAIESIEKTVKLSFDRSRECRVHSDVFVAIYQDLHRVFSFHSASATTSRIFGVALGRAYPKLITQEAMKWWNVPQSRRGPRAGTTGVVYLLLYFLTAIVGEFLTGRTFVVYDCLIQTIPCLYWCRPPTSS